MASNIQPKMIQLQPIDKNQKLGKLIMKSQWLFTRGKSLFWHHPGILSSRYEFAFLLAVINVKKKKKKNKFAYNLSAKNVLKGASSISHYEEEGLFLTFKKNIYFKEIAFLINFPKKNPMIRVFFMVFE